MGVLINCPINITNGQKTADLVVLYKPKQTICDIRSETEWGKI